MEFSYPKLQALCRENGITPTALEKTLHYGNGTIKKWASVSPRLDKVSQVAAYFGVTVNDLMEPDEKSPASTDADGVVSKLARLSPELREQLVRFLALAKEDPDRAARFLDFAAKELESQR